MTAGATTPKITLARRPSRLTVRLQFDVEYKPVVNYFAWTDFRVFSLFRNKIERRCFPGSFAAIHRKTISDARIIRRPSEVYSICSFRTAKSDGLSRFSNPRRLYSSCAETLYNIE